MLTVGIFTSVFGQVPVPFLPDETSTAQQEADLQVLANEAIALGLNQSDAIILQILDDPELSTDDRIYWISRLAELYLARGQSEETASVVEELTSLGLVPERVSLFQAMIAWYAEDWERARLSLASIDSSRLEERWLAWYWCVVGMLAEQSGQAAESSNAFRLAQEVALAEQIPFVEFLLQRNRLLGEGLNDEEVRELSLQLDAYRGQALEVQFAEQLALARFKRGEVDAARIVLQSQRQRPQVAERRELLDRLLWTEALMMTTSGGDAGTLLLDLLDFGQSPEILRAALSRLLVSENPELLDRLRRWSEQLPEHPILAEVLFFRAMIEVQEGDEASGFATAQRILERFPGSPLVVRAQEVMGYVEWRRQNYRSAASRFAEVLRQIESRDDRLSWQRLLADAYFLSGDYALAEGQYRAISDSEGASVEMRVTARFQQITCLIRLGDISRAESLLDSEPGGFAAMGEIWRAEWNVAYALRQNGERERALERIRRVMSSELIDGGLLIRYAWLEARLLLELDRYDDAIMRVDALDTGLGDKSEAEVIAEILLIAIEAAWEKNRTEFPSERLQNLRERYPDTQATPKSYWLEGRFHAEAGRLIEAEGAMNTLTEAYPETEWARVASFEAANFAQRRGDITLAISRLEAYVDAEGDKPLAYQARLRQSELFRQAGRFDESRALLDQVIEDFAGRSDLYLAEMMRADSLAAGSDSSRLENAVAAYVRLLDLGGVPRALKVEAQYKLGALFERLGRFEDAQLSWLASVERSNRALEADEPLDTGAYWAARSLLNLSRSAEVEGDRDAAILTLERLISLGLPGRDLALANLERLRQ